MKGRALKPTRKQKEIMSGHYLNPNHWFVTGESEFYLYIVSKETGKKRTIDRFPRKAR